VGFASCTPADALVLFVCFLYGHTVTDFSVAGKARGMKFCMRVGLLSGQVFSPFGKLLLTGSHGGCGIMSGCATRTLRVDLYRDHSAAFGIGAAAWLKAVWWDLRLASLLTHLFQVVCTLFLL